MLKRSRLYEDFENDFDMKYQFMHYNESEML